MKKFTYNRNAKRPKVEHTLAMVREATKRIQTLPEVITPQDIDKVSDDNGIFLCLTIPEDVDNIATFYLDFPMYWKKDNSIEVKRYYLAAGLACYNGQVKRDDIMAILASFERRLMNMANKKYLDGFNTVSILIG